MAKARQIVRRRRAVGNIRKITQTMQLIATARIQKCLARASASKPYTEKLTQMVGALAGGESTDHPLLKPNDARVGVLLIITSNRGLCGGYNTNVLKQAIETRKRAIADGRSIDIEAVGKKAVSFLRFLNIPTAATVTDLEDKIAYARVAAMAERYIQLYSEGKISRVDVAYTRFNSLSSQKATVAQLLPMEPPKSDTAAKRKVDFEFSPAPAELLSRLIPETVKIRLYQYFNDAIVSEQVARMIAMKQATDAAADMGKFLTRQYNRARQSQITMELLDIVGGAEAIK
jgi:F-type H+-transporting ATPase subunit gamma